MFPLNGPTTSSMVQQNNGLLGAQQIQSVNASMPNISNSTAPSSSAPNPVVANMVKALKGSQ
jgi:hypothetical protein